MPRFQFEPFVGNPLDIGRAKAICQNLGARHIRIAYPLTDKGRGTNRPRTIAFTASDDMARQVAVSYGMAFVRDLGTRELI